MDNDKAYQNFNIQGKVAVVTGGAGVLGSAICRALTQAGASVAVLGLHGEKAEALAADLIAEGGQAVGLACNVLDRPVVESTAQAVLNKFGRVDILINGAGGNRPKATTQSGQAFFDLPDDTIQNVVDLNLLGTIIPSQVFGKIMAQQGSGVILNVSSMTALQPLTRVIAYSAAKAGVNNFTQWLAVHMAQEYSANIRVNAIAPGFFLTEQNRFLLTEKETGNLTPRGNSIIAHTPQGRFGNPDDLLGAVLWLVSPAASFVTGIVLPVDGGFSAFSGV